MEQNRLFTIEEEDEDIRIDKFLSEYVAECSRTYLQKLITEGKVTVNDCVVRGSYRLKTDDQVHLLLPESEPLDLLPEDIPLDIVYEDNDIIVINKAKGMVVHPAPGHQSGTLVNALLFHCKDNLSGINGILRPGIVHRIDKDTTGILIVCKNDDSHKNIAEQLRVHSGKRIYYAIVHGYFDEPSGRIEAPIGRCPNDRKKMAVNSKNGKQAVTNYRVLEELQSKFSYVECRLETGRTHQIRVHMSHIRHPLLGDTVYSNYNDSTITNSGQVLHAALLGITHPVSGEYMEFSAPLPEYFIKILDNLRG